MKKDCPYCDKKITLTKAGFFRSHKCRKEIIQADRLRWAIQTLYPSMPDPEICVNSLLSSNRLSLPSLMDGVINHARHTHTDYEKEYLKIRKSYDLLASDIVNKWAKKNGVALKLIIEKSSKDDVPSFMSS